MTNPAPTNTNPTAQDGLNQVAQIKAQKPPAFARGTNFAPGGMALVGEEGPELVNLPRGSGVSTASETKEALGARFDFRGANFSFGGSSAQTVSDVDAQDLALRIEDVIRRGEAPGLEGALS